jgi:hypothetical protein
MNLPKNIVKTYGIVKQICEQVEVSEEYRISIHEHFLYIFYVFVKRRHIGMAVNVANEKEISRTMPDEGPLPRPSSTSPTIDTILPGLQGRIQSLKRTLWTDPEFDVVDVGFGRILHAKLPRNSAVIMRSSSVLGMMAHVSHITIAIGFSRKEI